MKLKAWASSTALALLSQTAFAYQYGICSDGVAQNRRLRCTYSHDATEYIDINRIDGACYYAPTISPPPPYPIFHVLRQGMSLDQNSHTWYGTLPAGCLCVDWTFRNYVNVDFFLFLVPNFTDFLEDTYVGPPVGCPPCP